MWSREAGGWAEALVSGLDAEIAMPEVGIALPLGEIYRDIAFPAELRLVLGE